MKKVILSATFGLFALTVCADVSDSNSVSNENGVVTTDEGGDSCNCSFDGLYGGVGVGGSFLKGKVSANDKSSGDKNCNRFIGSLVLGGGKAFKEKFYVGGEVLCDFTGSKKNEFKVDTGVGAVGNVDVSLKHSGIAPEFGLRFGVVVKRNWLLYGKVAGSFNKLTCKIDKVNVDESVSKLAPALALGVERAFCKKFSARLEGEYVFGTKKTEDVCKLENKGGFKVRALVVYNVKL
jgi:opacity protein-like surface antigen